MICVGFKLALGELDVLLGYDLVQSIISARKEFACVAMVECMSVLQ
jgi:hypothetical protein